jgi:hypothetical protein
MFETTVQSASHSADNDYFDPGRQQVRDFVGNSMARSPSVHIEGMSENQPAPMR